MLVAAVEPKKRRGLREDPREMRCRIPSVDPERRPRGAATKKGTQRGLLPMRGALHYSANGTCEVTLLEHIHSANVVMQGGVGSEGGTGVG
eukprot:scaffold4525_cov125-Isochrysis_galbana.AAC.9